MCNSCFHCWASILLVICILALVGFKRCELPKDRASVLAIFTNYMELRPYSYWSIFLELKYNVFVLINLNSFKLTVLLPWSWDLFPYGQIIHCIWDEEMPVTELSILPGLASKAKAEEGTSGGLNMTEIWLCQLRTSC